MLLKKIFDEQSVCVYYTAKRIINKFHRSNNSTVLMKSAFAHAFEPDIDFSSAMTWFIEKNIEESMKIRRAKNFNISITELNVVRSAVATALGEYNEPYVDETPPQIFITHKDAPKIPLLIEQLSGGCRAMLALVMDLARRLVVANQTLHKEESDILCSSGIVLIDEIELHLHPAWQQTVLLTLCNLFPNIKFIVTTNSPQYYHRFKVNILEL